MDDLTSTLQAVIAKPDRRRGAAMLNEAMANVLYLVSRRNREGMQEAAKELARAVRSVEVDLNKQVVWAAWIAGQIEALTTMLRLAIAEHIPFATLSEVRSRRNAISILRLLSAGPRPVSDIAAELERDLSQTIREIETLETLRVIECTKKSRRWVRLTQLGQQVLTEVDNDQSQQTDDGSIRSEIRLLNERVESIATMLESRSHMIEIVPEAAIVDQIVDDLPQEQRTVATRFFRNQEPLDKIARELDTSIANVDGTLSEARASIKECLAVRASHIAEAKRVGMEIAARAAKRGVKRIIFKPRISKTRNYGSRLRRRKEDADSAEATIISTTLDP
jgi:DNA-directed RNA polymerase specialized sigma24 family protein